VLVARGAQEIRAIHISPVPVERHGFDVGVWHWLRNVGGASRFSEGNIANEAIILRALSAISIEHRNRQNKKQRREGEGHDSCDTKPNPRHTDLSKKRNFTWSFTFCELPEASIEKVSQRNPSQEVSEGFGWLSFSS
jgi:hypothetical protein